jgi:hypothetical protein
MELQDTSPSPSESLQLIEAFIGRAKQNLKAISFDLLLWGILVAFAALSHYLLLTIFEYKNAWLPWPVLMIGGSIFTTVYHVSNRKKEKIKTFTDTFLMWLSICSGLVYFVIAFLCVRQTISPLPFMLAHTSVLILVTGGVLKFKPLIAGGILFIAGAIFAAFLEEQNQLLLTTGIVIFGYLVPGILLRKEKSE